MRSPAPLAIISALLLCCAAFSRPAHSQTAPAKNNSNATVSGKVTIKGKPAPGVVVGVRSSRPAQFDPTFKATTDQDGNYRITEVPAGSYAIAPVAPAFVISEGNNLMGQMIVIGEGENVEGIDFEMVRGGVITGRVTDADGHPVIEERVSLVQIDQGSQRGPVYSISTSFQTDDRGIYRMFGVRPGHYKVAIGEGEGGFYRTIGRGGAAPPTTYYPDATDAVKAKVVEIEEGTEANNIDISLGQPSHAFAVSGRIVDGETGKPVPRVSIGLSKIVTMNGRNNGSYGVGTDVRSNTLGDFRLENLAPGKYSISIFAEPSSDVRADPVSFDILDSDVTGIVIKSSIGASVSGAVVLEGTRDSKVAAAMAQAFIGAYVRSEGVSMSGKSSRLGPDGSFRVGGLQAGTVMFSVNVMNDFKGLTISRIERDGVVLPNGLQVQNAEQVTGVRVFVAYSTGSIRGTIKTENGTLPPNAHLLVQMVKPGDANNRNRAWDADARGHFLIEGLPAGTYELQVVAYLPESRVRPPTAKQVVTVTDGAATEVTLTIDLAPPPSP
jgi:protocatechuate 3,4-dioxygenase beta subunit